MLVNYDSSRKYRTFSSNNDSRVVIYEYNVWPTVSLVRPANLISPEFVDVVEGLAERGHLGGLVILRRDVVARLTAHFDAATFLNVNDASAAADVDAFNDVRVDTLSCEKGWLGHSPFFIILKVLAEKRFRLIGLKLYHICVTDDWSLKILHLSYAEEVKWRQLIEMR